MKRFGFALAGAVMALALGAQAESFNAGAVVYAAPTGGSDWYSGCVVKGGPNSNSFYQVECSGTVYYVSADRISTSPPQPQPDPMRPGQMLRQTITPSTTPAPRGGGMAAAAPVAPAAPRAAGPGSYARTTTGPAPGSYAEAMHQAIAKDKADAQSATLASGKYACYAGGQYTFSDLIINGPHSYSVGGASGAYSYANGALTFTSGPYAGAYSRMVDGHTIGVSARGSTNLGTQCGLTR